MCASHLHLEKVLHLSLIPDPQETSMALPRIAEDIMTRNVLTCTEQDTVAHAHQLMAQKSIRHLPVVSSASGDFLGVITQKEILHHAFSVVARSGMATLESVEATRLVSDIMTRDVETIQPQLSLKDAGRFFMQCKHGCLPIVVEGKLQGILTSADFVKLSVNLLDSIG